MAEFLTKMFPDRYFYHEISLFGDNLNVPPTYILLWSLASPRIISVLADGMEGPLNEQDLDVREQNDWSFWNASEHAATMGTLALELLTRENSRLSIVHWFPGLVATPGLAKAKRLDVSPSNPMGQQETGERAVFLAASDRCAAQGGLVLVSRRADGSEEVR
jgi:hypothetical protein